MKMYQPFETMVEFSSGLEMLAEIKRKAGHKGVIQASWRSPSPCRRGSLWPASGLATKFGFLLGLAVSVRQVCGLSRRTCF